MADPLSVAGSAVGIVSLGLSVCQGLISYYGPWRAYDQEIGELAQKAEGLKSTLRIVQGTLQNFEPTWKLQANDVQSNINSCREVLHKLEKAIEKYGKTEPPPDFAVRLQGTGKRALYPFKRKTLIWLRTSVEGVQMNLNTTLQVLQLALMAYQKEQTDQLISTSISTALVANKICETICQLDTGLSVVHKAMAKVQTGSSREVSGINGSERHLQYMNPSTIRLQQELIREPTLVRVLYDVESQVNTGPSWQSQCAESRKYTHKSISRASCSCSRQLYTSETTYRLSRASIFYISTTSHDHGCPLEKNADKKRTIEINCAVFSYLLRFSIKLALSVVTGAGGLSIGPQLVLRNIVPDDAPAFKLLADLVEAFKEMEQPISENFISDVMENTSRKLHMLFDSRTASPTDVTLSGQTLLHYASHIFRVMILAQNNAVQSCRRFLKGIIDAGANVNDIGNAGRTPVDYLAYYVANYGEQKEMYSKVMAEICKDLIDAGAVVSENAICHPSNSFNPLKIMEIALRYDSEYSMALDMPDIMVAIVSRSEKLLAKTISKYPASINTKIGNNLSPLHFSVGWPCGVSMLLNAGAKVNVTDVFNQLPLYYACLLGCVSTVLLLLEAGSAIFTHSPFQAVDILDCAIQSHEPVILRKIILAIAQRRQKLQNLAEATLPECVLSKLNLSQDRLLDSEAGNVWKLLSDYGIQADESLNPGPRSSSVYHTRFLNLRTATELFKIGFHDVSSFDWIGETPLTRLGRGYNFIRRGLNDSLALGCWLISNGADISQEVEGISVSCRMGHDLGDYLGGGLWALQYRQFVTSEVVRSISRKLFSRVDAQGWGFIHEIFEATTADNCLCACSSYGCRPLTKTLKMYEEGVRYIMQTVSEISRKDLTLSFLQGFIEYMMPYSKGNSTLPNEIIRFITFTELDLTHTCCNRARFYNECLPAGEVEEIRAEQRHSIEDLEELVNNFEEQYKELGLPLHIFLQEYWSPKMDELVIHDSELDVEVVKAARELGVILELC